jgi:Protein of unknown function (DUF1580)
MFHFPRSNSSTTPPESSLPKESAEPLETELVSAGIGDLRQLFPLTEAHRHLPRRQGGKKLHRTTLGRWASKGCRGVVLKTWLVGGIRYTNAEAVAEFVSDLNASRDLNRRTVSTSPRRDETSTNPTSAAFKASLSASRRDRIEEDLARFGV